jgi:CRISPR-associated protein Cas1
VEAQAARRYWETVATIAQLPFPGRQPRSGDPLNMALSYGYSILYSIASDALTVAGLDPYAGFLHTDRSGRESLTYDYSDTYKPIAVDRPVLTAPPECLETYMGSLTYNARRCLAQRILENIYKTTYTDARGKRRTLRDHIYTYAWSLATAIRSHQPYQAFTTPHL